MQHFCCERLQFSNFMDIIWTWTIPLKKIWTVVGLGLSFKKSGMDLDRKFDSPFNSAVVATTR